MASLKPAKKLITITGEYTNQQGEKKNKYMGVGTMFKREDGTFAIKIDALPVGFSGWIGIVPLDEDKGAAPAQQTQAARPAQQPVQQQPVQPNQAFDAGQDDLPF